jgi:nucleoid-associated protein YgaU
MRKDVKFGLTIGAILVVTLVIYVIVLSRGPVVPPHISSIAPALQNDQSGDFNDPGTTPAPHSNEVAKANPDDQADLSGVPAPNDSTGSTTTPPPTAAPEPAPATQPTPNAQSSQSDWQKALDGGLPSTLSAPERTETPTIDPSSTSNVARTGVTPSANTPMIDPIPATQPTRFLMSNLPPAYAADLPPSQVPTVTPPAPADNTPRTHRVAPGESPYSISEEVYGSGRYYKKILAANPNVNPRHLKIGQVLVIPELTDSDKPGAARPAANPTVNPSVSYVVVSGDTLETISRKLYGNPGMIEQLYQANKTLIGPDENVLKIGWVLKLPSAPTLGDHQ